MGDNITLTSTTDTAEEVNSALGVKPAETPADKPAVEAKPAEVAVVADPVVSVEDEEDDTVEAAPAETPQAAGGKKRGKLQSRIDELVKERNEARGNTAARDSEVQALRKRLDELVTLPAQPKTETSAVEAKAEVKPKPTVDQFPDYEAYTEAVAEWKAEQIADKIIAKRFKEEADKHEVSNSDRARQEAVKTYEAGIAVARDKYDDYDDVVGRHDLKITPLMADGMLSSPIGPEVAYYLGKHPEECTRLYNMGHSIHAVREFGRIESKAEAWVEANKNSEKSTKAAVADTASGNSSNASAKAPAQQAPAPKAVIVTGAPDPITPVGTSEAASTVSPDQLDYQAYKALRNRQERERLGLR